MDLPADVLIQDTVMLLNQIVMTRELQDVPALLVGHSMGGAIAAKVAATHAIASLQGVLVVDVVEGTALSSLHHMRRILEDRPTKFPSPERAVQWAVSHQQPKSMESARLSIPDQLQRAPVPTSASAPDSTHDNGGGAAASNASESHPSGPWIWRTNLLATEPSWRGWFEGLTAAFLHCGMAKGLIVAGQDRLDKDMMIAQMQGKFQHILFPHVGHCMHEDAPETMAKTLLEFAKHYQLL